MNDSTVSADDAALVEACRAGDARAAGELVQRFQQDVFGTVLRLCRNRESALDLTNAILYKAYRNLDRFDTSRPLRPWLLRIATNETLNWLRSQRREREHVMDGEISETAFATVSGGTEPEATALRLEEREQVRAALATLPERYRLILTLRFFDDFSYQEIASHTGQDANTVGVQLLRARKLLKEALIRQRGTSAAVEVTG